MKNIVNKKHESERESLLRDIKEAEKDVAAGRVYSMEEVKEYFRWHKQEKKSFYEMDEVMDEILVKRKEKRFQNLCLDIYYWFYRNFDFIWKPYILVGYARRAWQRCTRGWSDRDLWSLDYTIAKFVLPRLVELKKQKHGTPCSMFNELPAERWEHTDEETEAAEKKWEGIMDEMIFAIDYIANNREWDYYPDKLYPEKTTKEDYDELRAVEERVQKGLELMGHHFRSLWD